ncbi:MAG: host specificity factor TipJ family phage tail protein [Desulfuromonadales bacterium]|nr:host specificity factor TipJ family phage tail protein [Desulfuromonadales bacterium]
MDHTGVNALSESTVTNNDQVNHLVVCPNPLSTERRRVTLPAGGTLYQMLAANGVATPHAHVFVDDALIPIEQWGELRPAPGANISVRVIPAGGDSKNTMRIVLQIAVLAVSVMAPGMQMLAAAAAWGNGTGAALLTAGVGMVGNLAINALIPPPKPTDGSSGLSLDRGHAITGTRNRANPYGAVPCVLGTHRLYPPLAAMPYTETLGDKQYYRMLFTAGYGPVTTSEFKIGETDIATYSGVEIEEGISDVDPPALFSTDVYEESIGVKLPSYDWSGGTPDHAAIPWTVRTTQSNTDEITIDLAPLSGLLFVTDHGNRKQVEIDIEIQFSPAGEDNWSYQAPEVSDEFALAGNYIRISGKEARVKPVGLRYLLSKDQYDVRMRRVGITLDPEYAPWHDQGQERLADDIHWVTMRSIAHQQPVTMPGVHLIALRIQATDQLEGVLDRFNLIAQKQVPVYDGASWTIAESNNPAWQFAEVLTGSANKRPMELARLDGANLKAWADDCEAADFSFSAVIDGKTTVTELLRNITAVGRAAISLKDGLYGVVQDAEQTVPVQVFSPRNSWGFKGNKVFSEQPHALRVTFLNKEAGYKQDEITVYDDGYDETNANIFDTMQLYGVDNADQAWKLGRYHIAVARLRPESYELSVDVEHIVCTRGDLVRVAHDVSMWGAGSGRIKAINGLEITLDEQVEIEAAKLYVVRIRHAIGDQSEVSVTGVVGATNTLTLAYLPISIAVGDLLLFGEASRESVELLVKSIEPGEDLTARLRLVDAAPEVLQADQGVIPQFNPNLSGENLPNFWVPPIPSINAITSVAQQPGVGELALTASLVVSYAVDSGGEIAAATVEAQYRQIGDSSWHNAPPVLAASGFVLIDDLALDEEYEVRLRSLSSYRTPSDWSSISTHTPDGSVQHAYLQTVSDLRVAETEDVFFEGRNCNLTWSFATDPTAPPYWFKHFKLEILPHDDTPEEPKPALRTETLTSLDCRYSYTFFDNNNDGGGAPNPQFKVRLTAVDISDVESAPVEVTINNTVPEPITSITGEGGWLSARLSLSYPIPEDFKWVEIWRSDSPDRSYAGAAPHAEGVAGNSYADDTLPYGQSYYYWARVVDCYQQKSDFYPIDAMGGIEVTPIAAVSDLKTILDGQLSESQLHQDLISRIDTPGNFSDFDAAADYAIGDVFNYNGILYQVKQTQQQPNINPPRSAYYDSIGQYASLTDLVGGTAVNLTQTNTTLAQQGLTLNATSSEVSTLSTTVDGNTATIQTQQTTLNGVEAEYTLKLDANGTVVGFGLINTEEENTFEVYANRFAVSMPAGMGGASEFPFVVGTVEGASGVHIDSAFIGDANVETLNIANDAVIVPVGALWAGYATLSSSTDVDVVAGSIDSKGQPVSIDFSFATYFPVSGQAKYQLTIKRGSTTIYGPFTFICHQTAYHVSQSISVVDNVGTDGTESYHIYMNRQNGSGTIEIHARSAKLLGLKHIHNA